MHNTAESIWPRFLNLFHRTNLNMLPWQISSSGTDSNLVLLCPRSRSTSTLELVNTGPSLKNDETEDVVDTVLLLVLDSVKA